NPTMKENAHSYAKESFVRAKQDIMTVKHVIGHHKVLENDIHGRRIQATQNLITANQAEKTLAANQIRLVQSAMADARLAFRPQVPLNPSMSNSNQAPTMSPKPSVRPTVTIDSAHIPTPTPPAPSAQDYQEKLKQLRRAPSLTTAE